MANDMANAPAQPAAQIQPLADLPVQSTKKSAGSGRSKTTSARVAGSGSKKVLQPLAELLPAQAAAELVQPGPASQAQSCQVQLKQLHNTMKRRWTRIRTCLSIQKTSVQPLAELKHQWS